MREAGRDRRPLGGTRVRISARQPLIEAGDGVAEGFELAEEELIPAADHTDGSSTRSPTRSRLRWTAVGTSWSTARQTTRTPPSGPAGTDDSPASAAGPRAKQNVARRGEPHRSRRECLRARASSSETGPQTWRLLETGGLLNCKGRRRAPHLAFTAPPARTAAEPRPSRTPAGSPDRFTGHR